MPKQPTLVPESKAGHFRFIVDDLTDVGQDSFSSPPSQNPAMWERLTNVMPIIQKGIQRRWGYRPILTSTLPTDTNRLDSFQRDSDQLRTLIAMGPTAVQAFLESGEGYNSAIFVPSAAPRLVNSRSFAYFLTGNQVDLRKWDGSASGGVSKWGIALESNTVSLNTFSYAALAANVGPSVATIDAAFPGTIIPPYGPPPIHYGTFLYEGGNSFKNGDTVSVVGNSVSAYNITGTVSNASALSFDLSANFTGVLGEGTGGTATKQSTVWSAPTNAKVLDGNFATHSVSNSGQTSKLLLSNYSGLSIPLGAQITGIQVDFTGFGSVSGAGFAKFQLNLLKAGADYGSVKTLPSLPSNSLITFGGPGDLWGGTWNSINFDADFGVAIQGAAAAALNPGGGGGGSFSTLFHADAALITVFYQGSSSSLTVTSPDPGDITLTVGRIYFTAYQNSTTGHRSDLSAASGSSGPVTSKTIHLSDIPVSDDSQVDTKLILATADGGDPSTLYLVAEIPNATTDYDDDVIEEVLVLNQIYQFTDDFGDDFGVAGNTPPPPDIDFCIKHLGRLWGLAGQNLFFSKSTSELTLPDGFIAGKWEESWPAENYFDISEGAESGRGLYSDGQTIYIGTERHILRITGDDPTNFSEPEIVHAEVGLASQEVWKTVFIEGTPAGAMWLTPDNRVILSNFNSYTDVGNYIQDVLDSINISALSTAHAMFVTQGPYDLYMLAIPTGSSTIADTVCVMDIKSRRWYVWNLANPSTAMLFNVDATGRTQWLFIADLSIFQFRSNTVQDAGLTPAITARTSWLQLSSPANLHLLDELEGFISEQGSTLLTVEGANNQLDFDSPTTIVSGMRFTLGPFNTFKAYLYNFATHFKYYRLTFTATASGDSLPVEFLNGYLLRFQDVNNF